MQINIKPQDRSEPERLELNLHPALVKRLKDYAESLNGSDISYVASQIFEQVLPPQKAGNKPPSAKREKPKKDTPKEGVKKAA